jgi:hypothetical protein
MATGLIDYGIVKPELAGAFGAGIRAQQDERMQNQLAQQKLAMGQMQQEQAGLQLQDFKRRQSALDQLVTKAQQSGRTGTPKEYAQQLYDYAIAAREPKLIMDAQQVLFAAKEREDYDADLANRRSPAPTAAPAPAMPTGALGSGTFGIMPETTNALAPKPAPAPSVNALAPAPASIDPATAIRNEIVRLDMKYPGGAAKREIELLGNQLKELEKRYVVPNVGMVTGGGRTIVEAGIAPTDIKKLISERDKLPAGDPNRKIYDQAIADLGAQNRIAQQRLAFDQNKFAWEKANPGFELKEAEDGSIVGVNKRTLQAFPVSIGGAAPSTAPMAAGETPTANVSGAPLKGKGKEAPAKFNDTDLQLANLAGSLKEFQDEVGKNLFTGAKFLPSGSDTARMQAKYTALLMGVKDLYTLGALTGPDMSIIESQITNPASWAGKMTTKEGFKEQTKVIEDMLKRSTTNLENTYSRTPKAAREALKGLPSGASSGISGATPTNPLGLTIPGVKP